MGIGRSVVENLLQQMQAAVFSVQVFGNVVSIAAYVLLAIGLSAIAQKRSLRYPGLAWVPVAQMWLLGSISDHYHSVTKGAKCNRRTRLLVAQILLIALIVVFSVLLILLFAQFVTWGFSGETLEGVMGVEGLAAIAFLLLLPMAGVAIWSTVETFYAYHDLFCSCNPANKTLFTVLSIVLSCLGYPIVPAILIFISRNKTDGLPTETQSNYARWRQQGPEF